MAQELPSGLDLGQLDEGVLTNRAQPLFDFLRYTFDRFPLLVAERLSGRSCPFRQASLQMRHAARDLLHIAGFHASQQGAARAAAVVINTRGTLRSPGCNQGRS
jgi:hypothetical protein